MAAVEPASLHGADKELSAVGVGTGIGHAENTGTGVLELKVFVVELGFSVDAVATATVTALEITTLDHKVADDTVELATLVTEALLAGGEGTEVLGCPGNVVTVKAEDDTSYILAIVGNVKVDLVRHNRLGSVGRSEGHCRNNGDESQEKRGECGDGENGLHLDGCFPSQRNDR